MRRRSSGNSAFPKNRNKKILAFIHADSMNSGWQRDAIGNQILSQTEDYSLYGLTRTSLTSTLPEIDFSDYPYNQVAWLSKARSEYGYTPLCRIQLPAGKSLNGLLEEYGAIEICSRYINTLANSSGYMPASGGYIANETHYTSQWENYNLFIAVASRNLPKEDVIRASIGTRLDKGLGIDKNINKVTHCRVRIVKLSTNTYGAKFWVNGKLKLTVTDFSTAGLGTTMLDEVPKYFCPIIAGNDKSIYFGDCALIAGDAFIITDSDYEDYAKPYEYDL